MTIGNVNINNNEVLIEFDNYVSENIIISESEVLLHSIITPLSTARQYLTTTSIGNYALFAGGTSGGQKYSNVVDAYNASLVRTTPTVLSTARYALVATTIGEYALFGGGYTSSVSNIVDVYDASLTRTTQTPLSEARGYLSATTIGNYALFGGGGTNSNVVDAYSIGISEYMRLELPLSSRYKFSEHITEQVADKSSILVNSPATGYVKYKSGILS